MNDRPSSIAGSWYPGDAEILSADIRNYLADAEGIYPDGRVIGLVVPHAGYRYSGRVAAAGFAAARNTKPEVIAVISPLHRSHASRVLATAHDAYVTPLGRVELDHDGLHCFADLLLRRGLDLARIQYDQEHSLEIELPFMQYLWQDFTLLPIMIRDQSAGTAMAVAQALAETLLGRKALIVASSDLSHFHEQSEALQLDKELLRRLAAFDPQAILDGETEGTAYACGRGAIAAALWSARSLGAQRVTVLKHDTSGSATGDLTSVVGYASAVIWSKLRSEE
jgi:hypothetical protein